MTKHKTFLIKKKATKFTTKHKTLLITITQELNFLKLKLKQKIRKKLNLNNNHCYYKTTLAH